MMRQNTPNADSAPRWSVSRKGIWGVRTHFFQGQEAELLRNAHADFGTDLQKIVGMIELGTKGVSHA